MSKKSDNTIPVGRMDIDWNRDPSNGLPYSGKSVQRFIKDVLNTKATTGVFDAENMVMYLFKDELDKAEFEEDRTKTYLAVGSFPLNFGTVQYRIKVTPDTSTTINATINQESIPIEMSLAVESRELGEPTWEATGRDMIARVYVDANSTGTYVEVPELATEILSSSGRLSINIRRYIPTGTSRVRLYFFAKDDESISSSIMYTVTLAEMYIEAWEGNLMWNRALIEDEYTSDYSLGGFRIVGNIAKTIHIDISTASTLVASYSHDIGSLEAVDNAYFFQRIDGLNLAAPVDKDGESLPALTTGIYNVKVWLTSGTLTTEDDAVVYSIMYVASGDQYTAKLVVMNNSGQEVNNYDEAAHLCDYAIYNAGQTYGEVTIAVTPYQAGDPDQTTTLTTRVNAEVLQELNYSINLVTNSQNLSIRYRVTLADGNYQEDSSIVNNDEIFQSESGATFYLNPSLRANGESNKETVYNTANNSTVALDSVTWTKMSWVDGIDGWTEDDEGRKCLMVPARSRLTIPASSYRFLAGAPCTFEFCFKVKNVSDYTENIITIAQNPTQEGFMGIRVRPTNVTVHSGSDMSAENDTYQGTNFEDEVTIHLLISIQPNFGGGQTGKNLVTGYINGIKGFQFSYTGSWSNSSAPAVFGSDTADLYLYMVRIYGGASGKALSSAGAENNWLNSLATRDEKVMYRSLIESVLKSSSRQISYEEIKNGSKYNFFVLEMTSGSGIPSKLYPDGGRANIEMHYGKDSNGNSRSDWDWKIYDVETKGQGTTSMNYYLWNIRCRIDKTDSSKKRLVAYYDTPTKTGNVITYNEKPSSSSKVVWFDGEGNHPAVKRITAKINFASSMQSHKMGATKAYDVLHNTLEEGAMLNEAQLGVSDGEPMPTVAVYQYPAFGFQKVRTSQGEYDYTFIGLFTIGPDKGDKPTFGWDIVDEADLVSLEGVDHTPQMTKFNIPWDDQIVYHVNDSGDGFLAYKGPQGNVVNAIEVGNAGAADTAEASESLPVLVDTFKGAYDVVYDNSTLIVPIALDDVDYGDSSAADVLANINADIENFQKRKFDSRIAYTDVEFWIEGEYKLYHFEYESGEYVSGYKSGGSYTALDLRTDTGVTDTQLSGKTLSEQNAMFQQARRERFIANAPTYWDMRELVFNYVYLVVFGATDNFAKNQYPYYMGGKWRFRQDDLDTIIDIDNNGGQTKPYDIEFLDDNNGSPYFAGGNSVLWNLVHESLWDDFTVSSTTYHGIKSMGKEMLEAMAQDAGGANMYEGFINFFERYFWGRAQEYFPPSAYNIDGNIKYEAAWLANAQSVDPLRQSLGNHYSAERLWVKRRAVYCMSLFGAGTFSKNMDTYLGSIKFRPAQLGTMTITPAQSMYPSLILGAGDIRPTQRTLAGEECEFNNLTSDGNTVYTLQAVDYITDLGDLSNLTLGNDDGGTFSPTGKKLRVLKLGDADPTKTEDNNVVTLNIGVDGLPCLEVIDVRNAGSLSSNLNLVNCKRVKEVYAEGTSIASVTLPRGSKIEKLHLPENVTTLSYQVIKYLSDLVLPSDPSNISLVYLEECDALNGLETLGTIFDTDGQNLQFIRLLWNTDVEVSGRNIRMLAAIQQNKDKDGESHIYNGVDISTGSGDSSNPHLEGRLVAAAYYQSDIETLAGSGVTPSDSAVHPGMKEIQASYFGPLYITFNLSDRYIDFVDQNVLSALLDSNIGDGFGITILQESNVTSLNSALKDNSSVSTFDELASFTGLSDVGELFAGSSITKATLPGNLVFQDNHDRFDEMFSGCSSLVEVDFGGAVRAASAKSTNFKTFYGCTSLTTIRFDSVQSMYDFTYGGIGNFASELPFGSNTDTHYVYVGDQELRTVDLTNVTTVPSYAYYRYNRINSLTLGTTVTSIMPYAFFGCTGLTGSLNIPNSVASIGGGAFAECTGISNVTVPSSVVNPVIGAFSNCGTGTGSRLYIDGNTNGTGNFYSSFETIEINGNFTSASTGHQFGNPGNYSYTFVLKINGNLTLGNTSAFLYRQYVGFVEIMGTITGTQTFASYNTNSSSILHLGYMGVACSPDSIQNQNSSGLFASMVYVGNGEDRDADLAVLAEYLEDSDWQVYEDKLGIWYDYTGPYKTITGESE